MIGLKCHYCMKHVQQSKRGLCKKCLRNTDAAKKFPSLRRHTRPNLQRPKVKVPPATTALPGTPMKVEVLAARYEAGLDLFSPDDATYTNGSTKTTRRITAYELAATLSCYRGDTDDSGDPCRRRHLRTNNHNRTR